MDPQAPGITKDLVTIHGQGQNKAQSQHQHDFSDYPASERKKSIRKKLTLIFHSNCCKWHKKEGCGGFSSFQYEA